MIKQHAHYVNCGSHISELNNYLDKGWKIIKSDNVKNFKYLEDGIIYILEYKDIKEERKEKLESLT